MAEIQRTLALLRHAKSEWPEGVADLERPLAQRGRRDAPVAGRWLRAHLPDIDLVVCSHARRVRQTWELITAELTSVPRVRETEQLYDASAEDLLATARQLPDSARTVVFVGHNPGLEDLVGLLTGVTCQLKTSAIAVLKGAGRWSTVGPEWASLDVEVVPRAS
jgi:phosphohistidine phosphatase